MGYESLIHYRELLLRNDVKNILERRGKSDEKLMGTCKMLEWCGYRLATLKRGILTERIFQTPSYKAISPTQVFLERRPIILWPNMRNHMDY